MEKNQNKKGLKKIILLLLLFVGLGASITAGAYWAAAYTIQAPESIEKTYTVDIGQGKTETVTTTLVATGSNGETKELVPYGKVVDPNTQADNVSFDITVKWNIGGDFGAGYTGSGTLVASTVSVTNSDNDDITLLFEELFTVTYTIAPNEIDLGSEAVVTVKVVFANEPANKAEYDQVANKELTLKVKFEVTPTTTP